MITDYDLVGRRAAVAEEVSQLTEHTSVDTMIRTFAHCIGIMAPRAVHPATVTFLEKATEDVIAATTQAALKAGEG